jgi:23S rRNA (cytidine1920-2'-O)/16S rRNA (cytidine1409-2'-O)-methyltransferase
MNDERIDIALVNQAFFDSRSKAKQAIESQVVFVNGQKVLKASQLVTLEDKISILYNPLKYVSRGGLKLERGIEYFDLDLKDYLAMDIGASTGGFTDCMLQNGVKKVYAVDVGKNQLAASLKESSQVVDLSECNVRDLKKEDLDLTFDFISVDVSFIPLRLVLPVAYEFLKDSGEIVFLIKPQFEIGKHKALKKGVVKDKRYHEKVIKDVLFDALSLGFKVMGLTYSPVKGPKGNIEFLAYGQKSHEVNEHLITDAHIKKLLDEAHTQLKQSFD